MAVFGILLKKDDTVKEFIETVKYKIDNLSLVENPFTAKIIEVKGNKNHLTLYIIIMKPIYFNFCLMGLLTGFMTFIFLGFSYWLLPSILLSLGSVFWTARFYYWMLKLGLKKNGYNESIRYMSAKDIIEYIHL